MNKPTPLSNEKIAICEVCGKEFLKRREKRGSGSGRRSIRRSNAITIDHDSLEKNDVTIRDRDTEKQIRVKIENLKNTLRKLLSNEIKFENLHPTKNRIL